MSQQELERVEVIALRQSGQLSQAEAARRLVVTERQVRRLEVRVATHGAAGLRSARRIAPAVPVCAARKSRFWNTRSVIRAALEKRFLALLNPHQGARRTARADPQRSLGQAASRATRCKPPVKNNTDRSIKP